MNLKIFTQSILLSAFLFSCSNILYSQQLAFPTAEGYGKYTVGGRGGEVYEVTNLNDGGSGSLRAAVNASGPITVVFRVSGTIDLNSRLDINNSYITIAGQTAPGDGITIKGTSKISASEVIIRFIRFRAEASDDALWGRYEKNIILDHVSTSWSGDEVLSIYHCENVTIQWCMITEACTNNHNFGGIWGSDTSTYHHNLIAHNKSRNPRFASGCGANDYRNNVIYNWGYNSCYGGEAHQPNDPRNPPIEYSHINMIANYYKPGPGTSSDIKSRIADPWTRNGDADAGQWWVSDNFVEGSSTVTADNWLGVTRTTPAFRLVVPWPAMNINLQTAGEAYLSVLEHAGCSFPNRDSVDVRIIEEVQNGTSTYGNNGHITHPNDVGGWPPLASLPAPLDSDHDGMPDSWEIANGLDENDPEDRNGIGAGGYTNLEIYLNSLVSHLATGVRESEGFVPTEFMLEQNYPNPFNPSTTIKYSLMTDTHVSLNVYDINGRKIKTLINKFEHAGHKTITWQGENDSGEKVTSGTYIYQLKTKDFTRAAKLVLLR